jgi:2-methylcitrate dehydratase PrpD
MVLDMFVSQPFGIRSAPQIDASFNVRYCVASVLLRKGISLEHFLEDAVRASEIKRLTDKINLLELENPYTFELGASLTVNFADGREIISTVDYPAGEPELYPATKNDLIEKFYKNIAFSEAITVQTADKILALLENIENLENVSELTNLLKVEHK